MLSKELFVEQLSQLVHYKTIEKNTEEHIKCLEYIQSLLHPRFQPTIVRKDVSPILLASTEQTMSPDILFLAHADVVAGSDTQFSMQRKGDLLIGRGVSDMKFSIPIGVALLNEYAKHERNSSFMLGITTDEEIGGFLGAQYLATEYGLSPKILIVLDGGDNLKLITSSKGIIVLEMKASGSPTHPCKPYSGRNPIHSLVQAATQLVQFFPYSEHPKGEMMSTVYIEKIFGGNSTNVFTTASSLEATICHPEHVNQPALIEHVKEKIREQFGDSVEVRIVATGLPVYTDETHPYFRLLQEQLTTLTGRTIRTGIQAGGSDARHFAHTNTVVLMTKPHGGGIHGEREHVSITSSLLLYQALRQFCERI